MHIKKVVIQGFKSYKNQVETEPFHEGINVVVGANGSGKSNFFHAIRFVLSDVFNALPTENRRQLLHEGVGHAVSQAWVQIVFDNSDGRFRDERDKEIVLKRTIGEQRDEFHWNGKHMSKEGVQNMLESAGFSRSNPYYVVQQGKIMTMTTMTDVQRLELLKEIGGTKVFEDKRKQSTMLINTNKNRQEEMEDLVQSFQQQMQNMDEDLGELNQYTDLDKQRRAAQYCIFTKERQNAESEFSRVEKQRDDLMQRVQGQQHLEIVNQQVTEMDTEIKQLEKQKQHLQQRNQKTKRVRDKEANEATILHTEIQELEEQLQGGEMSQVKAQEELQQLQQEIQETFNSLQQINQHLAAHEQEESDVRKQLNTHGRRQQQLFQKQGRKQQFRNKRERDQFLEREIKELEQTRAHKQQTTEQLQKEIEELSSDLNSISHEMGNMESEAVRAEQAAVQADQHLAAMLEQKGQLTDEQKRLLQEEEDLDQQLTQLNQQQTEQYRTWESVIGHYNAKALRAAKRIIQQHSIQGVRGLLVELIHCPDHLRTAVDVAGGSSLYDMVVDNQHVAAQIIEYLNKEKCGRVRFMPLAELRPEQVQYPNQPEVEPLIRKIKHDRAILPAVQQTFGKVLLCKNIDVADQVASQTGLNCVTPEGDKADKKGTLTGGSRDPNRNKIIAMQRVQETTAKIVKVQESLTKLRTQTNDIASEIGQLQSNIQQQEHEKKQLRTSAEQIRQEVQERQERVRHGQSSLESKERTLNECKESLENISQKINDNRAELRTDLVSQLNRREQQELEDLRVQISTLQDELNNKQLSKSEIISQKQRLQAQQDSLNKRGEELRKVTEEWDIQNIRQDLSIKQAAYNRLVKSYEQNDNQLKEIGKHLDNTIQRLDNLKQQRETLGEEQSKQEREAQEFGNQLESLQMKRSRLSERVKELQQNIRQLGVVPQETCNQIMDYSLRGLRKVLDEANQGLNALGPVNQNVLQEYNKFKMEVEKMQERKQDMERQNEQIQILIEQLDASKAATIEAMFKQVAKNFAEVFKELVPAGLGELIMVKAKSQEEAPAGGSNQENMVQNGEAVNKYQGVKVKVSFAPGMDTMSMRQLSGGQKTLVSLALIFAIQRCDPAPFYLFDEVDAALDPQYRQTVANLLLKQSNDSESPAQYIITTFHPQIVEVGHKVYGVSHNNRISKIQVITIEDALAFLTEDVPHHTSESEQETQRQQQNSNINGQNQHEQDHVSEEEDEA